MKKIFCILGLIVLCACERPEYDLQLVCYDRTYGVFSVDAEIYESHADLNIKRLYKELRYNSSHPIDDSRVYWLIDQLPQIDDVISVSLPATTSGGYELPNKLGLTTRRDTLTGGMTFTLWTGFDESGQIESGSQCQAVIAPIDMSPENIPTEQLKEIKNCMNYIGNQISWASTLDERRIRVYDEKTGREMYIYQDQMNEIFGGIDPTHLLLQNLYMFPQDAVHACDVAQRLREYISAHIDTEYIKK